MILAPPIDNRTANDRSLLSTYAPDWKGESGDFGDALVRIFARYAEIVIERLNRTPEKNLLAYLDLLGEARLPPQPARVPLTFSLAAGSAADGLVPAATQVAAPPAEGDTTPIIFETERELAVIAATLDSVFARDPGTDSFNDLSVLPPVSGDRRMFRGRMPLDHSLYIGLDDLLGRTGLIELRLDFTIDAGPSPSDPRAVSWSIIEGMEGTPISPRDDTAGLAHTGQIAFAFPTADLPPVPRQPVKEVQSRWLRGTHHPDHARRRCAAWSDPGRTPSQAAAVCCFGRSRREGRAARPGFRQCDAARHDEGFFPFGERPRLGDVFYLSAGDAFAMAGAKVTLHITPSAGSAPNAAGKPAFKWESWDGRIWAELAAEFSDVTAELTKGGDVTFRLGSHPARLAVNGVDGCWVRVRITAGDYGQDASYEPVDKDHLDKGRNYVPPTFAPPSIDSLTVDYALTLSGQHADQILTYNDFAYAEIAEGTSFQPFRPTADRDPTLYLGFAPPATRAAFPNRPVALYFDISEPDSGAKPDDPAPTGPARLLWECWGGGEWQRPGLRDDTLGLARPGVLEFLAPAAFALRQEFTASRYWLRCRWEAGGFAFEPRLQRVLLNTVMAAHTSTILDETLGSSDGSKGQHYGTTRHPVIDDREELRVREPDLPSEAERKALEAQGGDDAIVVTRDAGGGTMRRSGDDTTAGGIGASGGNADLQRC